MIYKSLRIVVCTVFTFVAFVASRSASLAQSTEFADAPSTCTTFPATLNNNVVQSKCTGADLDQICYANSPAKIQYNAAASTTVDAQNYSYTDRVSLSDVQLVSTGSLDLTNDQWGVAFIKARAFQGTTAQTIPVLLVLYGDAQLAINNQMIKTETPSDSSFLCTATTNRATYIRSQPKIGSNIVQLLQTNTQLQVVGKTQNNWLLVSNNGTKGWIYAPTADLTCTIGQPPIVNSTTPVSVTTVSSLPFLGDLELNNGVTSACGNVPSGGLMVQIPPQYTASINLNGVTISGMGIIVNAQTQPNNTLVVTMLRGTASIGVTGMPQIAVYLGQSVVFSLSGNDVLKADNKSATIGPAQITVPTATTLCSLLRSFGSTLSCGFTGSPKQPVVPKPTSTVGDSTPIPGSAGTSCTFNVQKFAADTNPVLIANVSGRSTCGQTILRWNVSGVESAALNGQNVSLQGSTNICITQPQTYNLTLMCGGQTQTRSVTVQILQP